MATLRYGTPRAADSCLKDAEDVDTKREGSCGEATRQFNILQFQNSFYECIEELRIRRVMDTENEEKINQLVSIQHDHQRAIKEEISKNSSLSEKHSQDLCELRRRHDEKIHQLEAEKSKLSLAADSWEKEMKELKDDIRTLQLTKYALEKTIKDQDKRLQMQGSARSSHLSKMTELEAVGKDVRKHCNVVEEQLKRLEVNVKESQELNSRLSFINQHQTCVSESLKADLKMKTEEIVALRARLDGKPYQEDGEMKALRCKQFQMEHQLKETEKTCKDLLEQLGAARISNQSSLEALARSQQLSERHLASSNQNAKLAASLSNDIKNHESDITQLREDLCLKEEQVKMGKLRREEFAAESKIKEESLRSHLRTQQDENQSLIKARENLEELNSSWSKKNIEMVEYIRELKVNIEDFERRENEKPKKESKSTNTEAEEQDVKATVEITKEHSTTESESNYERVSNLKGKDSNSETPREKAGEVSKTSVDSSGDQISKQIETTGAEQVPISAQCETPGIDVAVKDGTAMIIQAAQNKSDKVEVGVKCDPPGFEIEAKICQPQGVKITHLSSNTEFDSKSASDTDTKKEKYPEADDTKPEKGNGMQMMVQEQGDPCDISEENDLKTSENEGTVKSKHQASNIFENQQIANKGKAPAYEHCSFKEAINQVDSEISINHVASQATVSQISPPTTNNQMVSHKTNQSDSQKAVNQVDATEKPTMLSALKAVNQMIPLKSTTQIISPKDIQVNFQKPVNQLDSSGSQRATDQLTKEFVKQDLDKKSVTIHDASYKLEQATTGKETLQLTSNKDVEHVKDVLDIYHEASGAGLAKVGINNPLTSKCAPYKQASAIPSSSPSCLNAFSRTGTRPSYILPGFSLLTTQPRHGITPRVNSSFSLPPGSPHGIRKIGNNPTPADSTLSETPTQRKSHDYPNQADKCPSFKGKEGSQEWPNFAEEFDSGPNSAPLSIEYTTSLHTKPTLRVASTVVPPELGLKRPAKDDDERLLFSDEDDEPDIKSDVASQINRIQSFLRSDRLKRPRRSNSAAKEPVV